MAVVNEPGTWELHTAELLRTLSRRKIEELGRESSASILGLAPSGVEALMWVDHWSLERAARIAEALHIPLENAVAEPSPEIFASQK